MDTPAKRGYEESCHELQTQGLLDPGPVAPMPARRPNCDDEEPLGVSFFRTRLADASLENLTIPRTFFGRSEIIRVSFRGTDLSESTLCWNDFIGVDFSESNLSGSDLRAAVFENVKFIRADLHRTDLRRSSYKDCDFTDADMRGAKLTKAQASELRLSSSQEQQVDWQAGDGDEPGGG